VELYTARCAAIPLGIIHRCVVDSPPSAFICRPWFCTMSQKRLPEAELVIRASGGHLVGMRYA
jgi:hypothetical protein